MGGAIILERAVLVGAAGSVGELEVAGEVKGGTGKAATSQANRKASRDPLSGSRTLTRREPAGEPDLGEFLAEVTVEAGSRRAGKSGTTLGFETNVYREASKESLEMLDDTEPERRQR